MGCLVSILMWVVSVPVGFLFQVTKNIPLVGKGVERVYMLARFILIFQTFPWAENAAGRTWEVVMDRQRSAMMSQMSFPYFVGVFGLPQDDWSRYHSACEVLEYWNSNRQDVEASA
jgi:hypothetical protein